MSPPRKAHVDDGPIAICSSLDRNRTSPYSIVDVAQAEEAHVHRLPKPPVPGGGPPRGAGPPVLHREREAVPVDCPVHVTLRVKPTLTSLRDGKLVREW